ncbi:MAG TPA: hypothetical protein VNJ07_05480, partial [Chitinophagales bacterium]|nr:hypothetical protein [Chitinophagales bacterium]
MRLLSYLNDKEFDRLALLEGNLAFDLNELDENLPDNMSDFLWGGNEAMEQAREYEKKIKSGKIAKSQGKPVESLIVLAPVPFPSSMRDAYAFRKHVEAARRNRGLEMIPEFDQFPVFYYTNHNS